MSKGSDQTARMRRLIWDFAGRTDHIVQNLMMRLNYDFVEKRTIEIQKPKFSCAMSILSNVTIIIKRFIIWYIT